MNTQSLPWLKFAHEAYRNGEFRAKASVIARCAYFELLMASAKQIPSFSIPDDNSVLANWSGVTVNQWLKVRDVVLSQFAFNHDDSRYYCTMLIELYAENMDKPAAEQADIKKPKPSSAERMAKKREREREAAMAVKLSQQHQSDTDVTGVCGIPNVTCDANIVTSDASVTRQKPHVTQENVTFGGVTGGDSELKEDVDLELNNSKATTNNLTVIDPPVAILVTETVQKATRKRKSSLPIEEITEVDLITLYGASPRYAKDWLAVRSKKSAPLTPSAMEGVISQAELAGISVADAIEVCAKKQWQGFNATWNYKDVISVQKTANNSLRTKGVDALISSGQSESAAHSFLQNMVTIYGDELVHKAVISVISNKPLDVTEYIGTFLKSESRQNRVPRPHFPPLYTSPIYGNVNDAFPITEESTKPASLESKKKLQESLHDLPF